MLPYNLLMVNITTWPLQTAYELWHRHNKKQEFREWKCISNVLDKHRQDIDTHTRIILVLVSSPHLNQIKQLFAIIGDKNIDMFCVLKKNHYYN